MKKSVIKNISPLGFPWKTQDPFLFCAYHKDHYPAGNGKMGIPSPSLAGRSIGSDFSTKDGWSMYHGQEIPGFPYHPHRGFETITINQKGVVDHSDSLGAAGRFMAGDVQWMTAGKGVQHSEMFPMIEEVKDNTLEIFQIWLNLPKVSKMVDPHFKMLWKEDIPVLNLKDETGKTTSVKIVAGNLNNTPAPTPTPDSWASNPDHAVGVYTVEMEAHAEWTLPATLAEANRSLFFYKGNQIQIEDQDITVQQVLALEAGAPISIKNGSEAAHFLILEGKPINEPVAQHGPFVMNTTAEIHQAISDYQNTQFGGWPWKEREVVHAKEKGRFALHSDGTEEIKAT